MVRLAFLVSDLWVNVVLFHYKLLAATDVDAFLKFVGIHAYTLEVVYRSVAVVGCID